MTWRDVFRRDLTSVYRSRTGTSVAAIAALSTVIPIGLYVLAADIAAVAAVAALLVVVAIGTLVFVGDPKQIAALVVTFTAAAVVLTILVSPPATQRYEPPMETAVIIVGSALSFVVPLVGLLGSYAALVGERETGSVRFLLGLPNSRDDAFVGKFCARGSAVCVPLVVGVALTGPIVGVGFEHGSPVAMLWLATVTVPYGLLFVGLGLTASAYAESSNRAVAVVIAAFTALRLGWPALQTLLLEGLEDPYPLPEWHFLLGRLNPINAYVKLTGLVGGPEHHPFLSRPHDSVSTVATTHEFAAIVLVAWTVAAPLFGLLYFRRRDLL